MNQTPDNQTKLKNDGLSAELRRLADLAAAGEFLALRVEVIAESVPTSKQSVLRWHRNERAYGALTSGDVPIEDMPCVSTRERVEAVRRIFPTVHDIVVAVSNLDEKIKLQFSMDAVARTVLRQIAKWYAETDRVVQLLKPAGSGEPDIVQQAFIAGMGIGRAHPWLVAHLRDQALNLSTSENGKAHEDDDDD